MPPFFTFALMASMLGTDPQALEQKVAHEGRFIDRVLSDWSIDTEEFVRAKLPHLLMVLIIAFVLSRLLKLITHRMIRLAERQADAPGHLAQIRTLAGVIRTTGLTAISAIAGLQFLAAVGVNLAPLLASAGVAGIAIGLAAQNIVRDVLNGILILIESQFNVGDTVKTAGVSGVVEMMTLRRTALRDADGTLHIVPNSQISTVSNQSAGYTQATVNVSFDYSTNPDMALALLRSIAGDLATDERFAPLLKAPPEVLGIDAVKGTELVIAVTFRTQATRQLPLLREFRRRVRLAAEAEKILPGDPNGLFRTVWKRGTGNPGPDGRAI